MNAGGRGAFASAGGRGARAGSCFVRHSQRAGFARALETWTGSAGRDRRDELELAGRSAVYERMTSCRILYFRDGLLEASEALPRGDVVEAAQKASSTHPHLTAEVWWEGRKVAVVRPCWNRRAPRRSRTAGD